MSNKRNSIKLQASPNTEKLKLLQAYSDEPHSQLNIFWDFLLAYYFPFVISKNNPSLQFLAIKSLNFLGAISKSIAIYADFPMEYFPALGSVNNKITQQSNNKVDKAEIIDTIAAPTTTSKIKNVKFLEYDTDTIKEIHEKSVAFLKSIDFS